MRAGVLAALLFNANRNPKKSRAMYPGDFFPLLSDEQTKAREEKPGPDGRALVAYLKLYDFLYRRKHGGAGSNSSH